MSANRRLLDRHEAAVYGELHWRGRPLLGISKSHTIPVTSTDVSFEGMGLRAVRKTGLAVGMACTITIDEQSCEALVVHVVREGDGDLVSIRLNAPDRAFIAVLERVIPTRRVADAVAAQWRGFDG